MGRLPRIMIIVLGTLAVLLAVAITATVGWRPIIGPRSRPLTDRKFDPTPERLARGRYLAENVAGAMHGQGDRN